MAIGLAALLLIANTCAGCDPVWRETANRHARPAVQGEHFDPQESDPKLSTAFPIADRKAEREVGSMKRDEKFIFVFWDTKKRILRTEYGINWKNPAELSPSLEFDGYGVPKLTQREKAAIGKTLAPFLGQSETFYAMWRTFDGEIWVTTTDKKSDKARIFYLRGPENEWQVRGPFELDFHGGAGNGV